MALFYYPNLSKNFLYSNSQGHPIQSKKKKKHNNFFVQYGVELGVGVETSYYRSYCAWTSYPSIKKKKKT